MEKEENILGKEKIGKLIRKFSIPCIISEKDLQNAEHKKYS